MAKRLRLEVLLFIYCSMMFLEVSSGNSLDEECVKRYSASYNRKARQTSGQNDLEHGASLAVDGNDETCSKTIKTTGSYPFWEVDLDKKININFIQVKNSQRHPTSIYVCIRENIGAECKIWGRHVLAGGETRIIRCRPTLGQSVMILGTKMNDSLSLCEVQVFDDTVPLNEGVIYDIWFNTTDSSYLFVNTNASSRGITPSFEAPKNILNHYGVKMTTYYNAPETGMYIFNMSGDNKCRLSIRDTRENQHTIIGRIPREVGLDDWTRYNFWNEAYSEPCSLTKGIVYELTALMLERTKNDHLRVGVTFPNGTFVGPMKSGIFITEEAARSLTKNCPSRSVAGSNPTPTQTSTNPNNSTEAQISEAASRILSDKTNSESKFPEVAFLEKLGFEMADNLPLDGKPFASYVMQLDTFVFVAVSFNLSKRHGFNFPQSLQNYSSFPEQASIGFPEKAFPPGIGRTSAVFMIFKMLKEMSDETGGEHNRLTSHVLSASMKVEVWNDMYKPFTLVFKNAEVSITGETHCVYWIDDEQCKDDGDFGRWSKSGCSLVHKNESHTTCECSHLTKFSVLFPVPEGSKEDEVKLELITYVGLSLSSVGCFITFIVYLALRVTRTLKTIVHLNLVLALGLADLVFLFGNLAENNKDLCFASTIITFYLYLAVFAWMLIEGVHLYFLVIRVFGSDDHRRKHYYHIFAWGTPAVVVGVTAGILGYDLMDEHYCWLSSKSSSIWVFIGPVLFVILVNTFILAAVLRTTMTLLRNDPGHRKEKSAMRTLAMLVPILGTTWVFGVVAFANDSVIFQYIFAVCNAFQGFFIFILYCLFNTEVRHEYQRRKKAWKTERELDSKRSPHNNSFDI